MDCKSLTTFHFIILNTVEDRPPPTSVIHLSRRGGGGGGTGWEAARKKYIYIQRERVFSHVVTAAILVSQNNGTAAMLVSQTNPLGVVLFSYANDFFCSNKFA